jgi:glycosyltransferase involved in cell wall biosynthesis
MTTERVPGLVSVVMASYNCGQFISQAIQSVLSQHWTDLELHVVDDGSTDGTRQVVEPFLKDPRVHYHFQRNAGQTSAKNAGIRKSRGEFVAFCDADDRWLPHKLSVQLPRFLGDDRIGVVYSRMASIDEHGRQLPSDRADEPARPSGHVTAPLFCVNFVPFGTAVVRRRCLDELGPFDERYRMGIDWELWLRLSVRYDFSFVDDETAEYRVWSGQMSTNWRGRYEHAFRIMREFVDRHPDAVSPATVRQALAHSYAQRARLRSAAAADYGHALRDVGRALRLQPTSRFAWKTLPAVVLAATGVRSL